MRSAVAVLLTLAAAGPALAEPIPTTVGQCAESTITLIGGRLEGDTTFETGTTVVFGNGLFQVSYDKVFEIIKSRVGDPARICLVELPQDCPPGDDRGRVYTSTNERTGWSWTLADSQHSCGGA
jgi:hypothetical protein